MRISDWSSDVCSSDLFAGDHVHADAAACQAADLVDGGEARFEDQRIEVAVGQHRIGADQATLLAALADRLAIEAAAVVADFQHDFRTLAAHRDADRTFLGFLRLAALLGRRSAKRSVGKKWVRIFRSGWSPVSLKKTIYI